MNPSSGLQTALNEIRNTLIDNNTLYQEQIPLVNEYTSSQVYGQSLLNLPSDLRNRFIQSLVNRIAYTRFMMDYFEKEFDSFAKDYDYNRPLPEAPQERRNRVWMCWWQGLENAPDLVKACVASVQKNAGNHEVTIITLENYKEYIDVPGWLETCVQFFRELGFGVTDRAGEP